MIDVMPLAWLASPRGSIQLVLQATDSCLAWQSSVPGLAAAAQKAVPTNSAGPSDGQPVVVLIGRLADLWGGDSGVLAENLPAQTPGAIH